MFKLLTKRPLWVNILAGFLLALLLFGIFLLSLGGLTRHGDVATVPLVEGKSLEEAKRILEKAGFDYRIEDSVFVDSLPPQQIIKQFPDANENVKSSRVILLVVRSAQPPLVEMPNLVGYSFRNALVILRTRGLKLGDTLFRPDFARNAVLEQQLNGSPVARGARIPKGSAITLILGDGVGDEAIDVPALIGLDYTTARAILDTSGLGFGAIVMDPDFYDTSKGYIHRQNPMLLNEDSLPIKIRRGQLIDIWIGPNKPRQDTLQQ